MKYVVRVLSLCFLINSVPLFAAEDHDLIRLRSFNDFLMEIIRQTGDRTVLMEGEIEPWPEHIPAPDRPWYDDGVMHIHYKYVFTPLIKGIDKTPKILLYTREAVDYATVKVYGKLQLFSLIQDSSNSGMILLRADDISDEGITAEAITEEEMAEDEGVVLEEEA